MDKNLEKVKLLARDLRNGKQFPRSPRQTLAGYVLTARAVDKCRAVLVGWEGEYHSNSPLDQRWLKFAEIDYDEFRSFVASGAPDDEIEAWIGEHAKKRPRAEIIAWNNKERDLHLSDLPLELKEYMEDYNPAVRSTEPGGASLVRRLRSGRRAALSSCELRGIAVRRQPTVRGCSARVLPEIT